MIKVFKLLKSKIEKRFFKSGNTKLNDNSENIVSLQPNYNESFIEGTFYDFRLRRVLYPSSYNSFKKRANTPNYAFDSIRRRLEEECFSDKKQIISIEEINEMLGTNYDSIDAFLVFADFADISMRKRISENFIREFQDRVDWDRISANQKLTENFIREFRDRINWDLSSSSQILSESFIEEFKDYVNWSAISFNQTLSEDFIRKFDKYVDWSGICSNQKLSECFIREFKNNVCWYEISRWQYLSEEFIREFREFVIWDYIFEYQDISDEFIEEFKYKIK